MSFDITIAFDRAEYLNPQLYLFSDSIKDKLPEDTIIHIVTNRDIQTDNPLKYLRDTIGRDKVKIYKNDTYPDLESRCRYMLNCFKIETTKPWVIKMELDFLFLKHLSAFEEILDDRMDILVEPENRKIFSDNEESRLWRIMYKMMGIKIPDTKIRYREGNEEGLPLFGTGLICINSSLIPILNQQWESYTRMVEPWGMYNVHPNEQAFTALVFKQDLLWRIYPAKFKFNPISKFRKGSFPSTDLIENSVLPEDTIILDYHHLKWLNHICKYNSDVKSLISNSMLQTLNDESVCKSKDGF